MRWLREWKALVESGSFEEAAIAACNFGSVHQKEFCFLIFLLSKDALQKKCTRDHQHVRIQGAFTKKSAAYTPELGIHLAKEFKSALRREAILADQEFSCVGLESVAVNDFVQVSKWDVVRSWFWKRARHINVLEVSAALHGIEKEAVKYPSSRFISLCGSGSFGKRSVHIQDASTSSQKSSCDSVGFRLIPCVPLLPYTVEYS